MNLTLRRTRLQANGIFGQLESPSGTIIAVTCEHSYGDGPTFAPKLPDGVYTCVRGEHRLAHMPESFVTFKVTNVPGHTNILVHSGNFPQSDSEGCILVGSCFDNPVTPTQVSSSRIAFEHFMKLQDGVDQFTLTVTG